MSQNLSALGLLAWKCKTRSVKVLYIPAMASDLTLVLLTYISCFRAVSSLVAHLVLIKVERWALSPFPSLFLSFSLNSPPRLPPPSKYLMPRYIYRELEPTLSLCPTLVALIKIGDGWTQLCPVIHDETLANEVRFVSPDCPYMRTSWCKDCLIRLRLSYSIK